MELETNKSGEYLDTKRTQQSDSNNNSNNNNNESHGTLLNYNGGSPNVSPVTQEEAKCRRVFIENEKVSSTKADGETKSENHDYIDINPLGPEIGRYSPSLVHLCVSIYSLLTLASAISTLAFLALLFTKYFYITLLYLTYIIWDRKTCNQGGCRVDRVFRSKFWSYLAAYFPIRLRHTANFKLDPNENYILNYHPHGISAFGAVCVFGTNGLKFSELFPGIVTRFMVHETSFVMPVMKETFGLRGDCSVNSKSFDHILSSKWKNGKAGNLLTLVGGGLAEADLSDAQVLKVVVAKRKGFVKKALIHGTHLIPCIAFGENSVFTKLHLVPGSILHRLENTWYRVFKFRHPIYYGRSAISDKAAGVLPYKRPITVVMGDPIHVERIEDPSQEDIDQLHERYLTTLKAMYAANKDLCSNYDKEMQLI